MIAEWGQLALLGALLISIIQGVLPLIGASSGNQQLIVSLSFGQLPQHIQRLALGSVNKSAGIHNQNVRFIWATRSVITISV